MSPVKTANLDNCRVALPPDEVIFGLSEVMHTVEQMVRQTAAVDIPVLIHGETGTGKEVLAHYIHRRSPRKNGPFVKISCAAIPASLLEAELFGYEQGAFTGAYSAKPGLVEMAHTGTLLLDHIAELDVTIQAKLLQLLQDGTFSRIGGQDERKIDARIVCITNRNLRDEVTQRRFRADLFHRINGASLRVPELRERAEDIPSIANYLIELFNETFGTGAWPLSPLMSRRLQQYRWPGNIRELENVLRRYVVLGSPEAIAEDIARRSFAFPPTELPIHRGLPLKTRTRRLVREVEVQAILRVLQLNNWNRRKAARMLSISYRALLYKIRSAGIGEYCPTKRPD
jgi:two-component system, NtrC family, response regulator AtoC